jgi:hypothetical protein
VAPSPVTRLRRTLWQWTWTGLGFVGAFTLVVRLGAMLGVW